MMKLPDYEKIRQILLDKGLTDVEINEKIEQKKSQYYGFVSDRNVLIYLVAKDLGIEIPLSLPAETIKIGQLKDVPEDQMISVKGFIVDIWHRKTKKGSPSVHLVIVDDTGWVEVGVFGGAVDKFKSSGCKMFDYVQLQNCNVWHRSPRIMVALSGLSDVIKIEKPDIDLNKILEVEPADGKFISFIGIPVALHKTSYVGCPNCYRSFKDVQEGDMTNCVCSPEPVKAVKLYWKRYDVLDSKRGMKITVTFDPSANVGPELFGNLIKFWGVYDKGELAVSNYQIVQQVTTVQQYFAVPKVSPEQLFALIDTFGTMPMAVLEKMVQSRFGLTPDMLQQLLEQLKSKGLVTVDEQTKLVRKVVKE
jgi:hypothetical protein